MLQKRCACLVHLEHFHLRFQKSSILQPQNLLYLLYQLTLQYTLHSSFHFYIKHNKIIFSNFLSLNFGLSSYLCLSHLLPPPITTADQPNHTTHHCHQAIHTQYQYPIPKQKPIPKPNSNSKPKPSSIVTSQNEETKVYIFI